MQYVLIALPHGTALGCSELGLVSTTPRAYATESHAGQHFVGQIELVTAFLPSAAPRGGLGAPTLMHNRPCSQYAFSLPDWGYMPGRQVLGDGHQPDLIHSVAAGIATLRDWISPF